MTPTATTIVVAREDFSIPGGEEQADGALDPAARESRFFDLLRDARPDVVVLDLSRADGDGDGDGVEMILKIRRHSSVPILVVCRSDTKSAQDYRIAGAAECISSPVELVSFNQVLQQIVRAHGQAAACHPAREADALAFAGVSFKPHQNLVISPGGKCTRLTTAESRLLTHFATNPWEIQTRLALSEALYGKQRPATTRAVDVVVNRLRAKLRSIGDSTQYLIKTEFRRGYRFVSDASAER
ncbi:MAG TPA: winged helix-turn-helix domain-containing protein [Stellaceae bacterium]|nr:winged helix-turn-helix domain-containing protein [Stellaceae bacterium]